jgi:hypothetical protein
VPWSVVFLGVGKNARCLEFLQVVLVERFGFWDGGLVPLHPVVGLVAADEKNGLSSRVEDEQDPAVFRCASWSQFFEVVVLRSFDSVSVWSVELWSAFGQPKVVMK